MIKSTFLSVLYGRLGNLKNQEDKDMVQLEVGFAQETMLELTAPLKPWFLLSEQATADTNINDPRVELPTDFVGEFEEGALYVKNPQSGKYQQLTRGNYDRLFIEYSNARPGIPEKYSMEGLYYRLFPTPDAAYVLQQRYYERDLPFESVPSNGSNRWLRYAAGLLMAVSGEAYATKHLQNPGLAALFQVDLPKTQERLWNENEARKHLNKSYRMGEE